MVRISPDSDTSGPSYDMDDSSISGRGDTQASFRTPLDSEIASTFKEGCGESGSRLEVEQALVSWSEWGSNNGQQAAPPPLVLCDKDRSGKSSSEDYSSEWEAPADGDESSVSEIEGAQASYSWTSWTPANG